MKFSQLIFISSLMSFALSSNAITESKLYQTTVPVTDESQATYDKALKIALVQVLIKLTGNKNINNADFIDDVTKNTEQLVQQFRYQQVPGHKKQESSSAREIWVKFDEYALNALLKKHQLPLWDKSRPPILIWVASQENDSRQLLSFEQDNKYLAALKKAAINRGLSLLFPLLDLEDSAQLSVDDIWFGLETPILRASARYQADIILAGKLIRLSDSLWQTKWLAYIEEELFAWDNQGQLIEMVLAADVDQLADILAARYANINLNRTEIIELMVTDINDLDSYAKVLIYLQSLQFVDSVKAKRITDDKVLFELVSYADVNFIEKAIKLDKMLAFINRTRQLNYRLLQ